MKSVSRLKGITTDGFGGVSGRSREGPSLARVSLDLATYREGRGDGTQY